MFLVHSAVMMPADTSAALAQKYDTAADRWRDKMRTLGYYDGYLGFLSEPGNRPVPNARVIDVGAGTAAFAEAWVAVNGAPADMLLVDLSSAMLERGRTLLMRRGMEARTRVTALGSALDTAPADEVLAAHLIEHIPDTLGALRDLRALLKPGGRLRLVVSKPHWCNAIIWLQWRHRTFGLEEMRGLLTDSGFEIDGEYSFPAGPPSRTSRGFIARRA